MTQSLPSSIKLTYDQDNCTTFDINDEDHTFGNSIRYMILKNPDVLFCGYSMPHPNEKKIVMQIQTVNGKCTPIEAFRKGLEDLRVMCQQIKQTFQTAYEEHQLKNGTIN